MADIELVIKMPEEMYAQTIDENGIDTTLIPYKDIIKNGTPLPKGHGDLKDADKLHYCECKGNFSECDTCLDDDLCNLVNGAPTIIEADKAESEN